MHRYVHTTIKMTVANVLATFLAFALNLNAPITAGILAILSIQLTRTDSFVLAGKRLICALLALGTASLFFIAFGYDIAVYFVFTFIFIALSFLLTLHPGIVPSLVLVTHVLNHGAFSWSVLSNTILLMITALIVALGLNVLYPLNTTKALYKYSETIDEHIRSALTLIGQFLAQEINHQKLHEDYHQLENTMNSIIKEAELIEKDILFDRSRTASEYLKMRRAQIERLARIVELSANLKQKHPYAKAIGSYVRALTHDIGHANRADYQKSNLDTLLDTYRKKTLPKTRNAFEVRAVLYQILFELAGFLHVKITYHKSHH